jgi:hypothetical protein
MRVIVACRDEVKGQAAVAQLLSLTSSRPDPAHSDAVFESLDVSSLASVRPLPSP